MSGARFGAGFIAGLIGISCFLGSCTAAPQVEVTYDPASLAFDGELALEIEEQLTSRFPIRHSGMPNNHRTIEWLEAQYSAHGFACEVDEWEVVNYNAPVPFTNLICALEGEHTRGEIVLTAHHDQAPTTIEGADNDASGVAIMLHLAEVFSSEAPPRYRIVFLTADGEEYGNVGTRRFNATYPNPDQVIAAISLDNLGRPYYNGLDIESIGQFRNYGALWLSLAAQEAAAASDQIVWDVFPDPIDEQLTSQVGPVNFMDQGPFIANGIPAVGLSGHKPDECLDLHFELWHDPRDRMELDAREIPSTDCIPQTEGTVALQSAESLGQAGLIVEALVRQIQSMDAFPAHFAPYLYFPNRERVLTPMVLYPVLIGFVGVFFLGAVLIGGRNVREKLRGWAAALPHFVGLWLPLVAAVGLLYLFVELGLMLRFDLYPATTKDPYLLNPQWEVLVWLILGLAVFFAFGRWLVGRLATGPRPGFSTVKSLGLLIVGISAIYPLLVNPMSLLFCVPLLLWLLITGRDGWWRLVDIGLFLLSGIPLYAMVYFFGWVVLRLDLSFFWYILHMFTAGTISFFTVLLAAAIIGAGLSMIVRPPGGRRERDRQAALKPAPGYPASKGDKQ